MPFSESLKVAVKRRAHFRCCMCESNVYVEVHHIIPESEGGKDTEDNAAPLCPTCHEIYGANATKRKFIRQKRDWWYHICAKRYTTSPKEVEQMRDQWENAATKQDVAQAVNHLTNVIQNIGGVPGRSPQEIAQEISDITTSVTSVVSVAHVPCRYPPECMLCGKVWPVWTSKGMVCPHCRNPM